MTALERPVAHVPRPGKLLATVGGAVATLLLTSLLFLSPALGFPFVDFPRLVGGIFTADPGVAFGLGFAIFFVGGWLIFPLLFAAAWPHLPGGRDVTFTAALPKGLLLGISLWVVSGLVLPLLGALVRAPGLTNPGLFALREGILAASGILLGHLAYGLALALIAAMGRGLSPLDVMGGYEYGQRVRNRTAVSGNR